MTIFALNATQDRGAGGIIWINLQYLPSGVHPEGKSVIEGRGLQQGPHPPETDIVVPAVPAVVAISRAQALRIAAPAAATNNGVSTLLPQGIVPSRQPLCVHIHRKLPHVPVHVMQSRRIRALHPHLVGLSV